MFGRTWPNIGRPRWQRLRRRPHKNLRPEGLRPVWQCILLDDSIFPRPNRRSGTSPRSRATGTAMSGFPSLFVRFGPTFVQLRTKNAVSMRHCDIHMLIRTNFRSESHGVPRARPGRGGRRHVWSRVVYVFANRGDRQGGYQNRAVNADLVC